MPPNANGDFAYWTKQLAGNLPRLDLPLDHPRRKRSSIARNTGRFQLSSGVGKGLRQLATSKDADLFSVLLAAFKSLLFRYTGQADIIVGASFPTATADPILAHAAGRPVLLRTRISDDTTYSVFLAQVGKVVLEAHAHSGIAFEKIAASLGPGLGQQPMVQATFDFRQDALFERAPTNEAACAELNLWLEQDGEDIQGELDFDADLFEKETIDRLIGHFQNLLEAILANPNQRISRLPLLTERERGEILVEWNNTATDFASDKTIHELFEEQAGREPDKVAIVFQDEELTFGELNKRANVLARRLQRMRVGPEVRVAVCLLRSIDMVVALYAIHKAGAAYVPVDPSYPTERIAFMLEDAQVPLVLTQKCLGDAIPAGQAETLYLDEPTGDLPEPGDDNLAVGVTPENVAYVIYTSGSTGKPKGVMVRHKNVVNFFTGMDNAIGRERGTWLAVTSISFDISVLELFWTLTRGFKVVLHGDDDSTLSKFSIPSRERNFSAAEEIRRHGVTHLQCTPSLAGMMLDDADTNKALCQVKTFLFGGEPMPAPLLERIHWNARIFNMYGPTETTVWSSVASLKRNDRITIGRPIANTRLYILDRHLQPLPARVAGELYIAGEGVTAGYLNRPELTEQRFIREPFVEDIEARMYRTGDLARFNADGSIEFLGRVDNQVKVRGHRIELGEIESVLRKQPGIRECVVSVWEAATNDMRLVGYFVSQPGADPQPVELRNALKSTLPDYMVPSVFHRLQTLPLTPNGKVDRKALPSPAVAASAEKMDAEQFGSNAPAVEVRARGSKGAVTTKLSLTEAQHEIWLGTQMSNELSCSFNQSVLVVARGPLDDKRLFASIEWLVKRHEALRTTFAASGEEQWVHSEMPVELSCFDLTVLPLESRQAQLDQLLKKEAGTPFDLTDGPLFRFQLARLSPEENILLVTLHHIVCDGCSLGILLGELGAHYSAGANGFSVPSPLEKTYSQFIRQQLASEQGQERANSEAFWLSQFSLPAPALPLPVDRNLSAPRKYAGGNCELVLNASTSQAIRKLSVGRRCSLTGTLLAGYFLLLKQLSEQSEIIIGLPMTIREGLGSDGVVGHCVNFLPLRLRFEGDPRFAEHLDRVWKLMIRAIEHQQITLGSLLQKLNGGRGHQPMISVMFNVDSADEPVNLAGCSTEVKPNHYGYSRFDLSLSAIEAHGRLTIRCEYSAELFERETINGWLKHYELLLSEAAANPGRSLSQLPRLQSLKTPVKTNPAPPVATARSAAAISSGIPPAEEPMTEAEKKLAGIWREVLLIEQIGRHESFFDIGGHSLLATRITARIAKAFGINLPVRVIFESPTIAKLAAVVDSMQREPTAVAPPVIGRRTREAEAQKLLDRLAQLTDADLQNLIRNTDHTKK